MFVSSFYIVSLRGATVFLHTTIIIVMIIILSISESKQGVLTGLTEPIKEDQTPKEVLEDNIPEKNVGTKLEVGEQLDNQQP